MVISKGILKVPESVEPTVIKDDQIKKTKNNYKNVSSDVNLDDWKQDKGKFKFKKLGKGPVFDLASMSINDIEQANLGECWFAAALISILDSNVYYLLDCIKVDEKNENYLARFYDNKLKPHYYKLTTQILVKEKKGGFFAKFGTETYHKHANWAELIFKAYSVHLRLTDDNITDIADADNIMMAIGSGGDSMQALQQITGLKTTSFNPFDKGMLNFIPAPSFKFKKAVEKIMKIQRRVMEETNNRVNQQNKALKKTKSTKDLSLYDLAKPKVLKNSDQIDLSIFTLDDLMEVNNKLISLTDKNIWETTLLWYSELKKLFDLFDPLHFTKKNKIVKKLFRIEAYDIYRTFFHYHERDKSDVLDCNQNDLYVEPSDFYKLYASKASSRRALLEKSCFNVIKKELENDSIMCCSTREFFNQCEVESISGHDERVGPGIVNSHAYALKMVSKPDPDRDKHKKDVYSITVINPWMSFGSTYTNAGTIIQRENDPQTREEFEDINLGTRRAVRRDSFSKIKERGGEGLYNYAGFSEISIDNFLQMFNEICHTCPSESRKFAQKIWREVLATHADFIGDDGKITDKGNDINNILKETDSMEKRVNLILKPFQISV